eukprot:GHVR01135598.1.p1 GENE.GHVR01135598.1~~GHVR01135598.1.p1  ORF type:complete len:107 (-),score=13.72 GHVR01135598.1:80-400(-)
MVNPKHVNPRSDGVQHTHHVSQLHTTEQSNSVQGGAIDTNKQIDINFTPQVEPCAYGTNMRQESVVTINLKMDCVCVKIVIPYEMKGNCLGYHGVANCYGLERPPV